MERKQKEDQGNPTEDPEVYRIRKLHAQNESTVDKEPEFKVDLRIEGVAHDVILKDEEPMGKIQQVVENSRKGSYTKPLREDLRKPENSMIFSEESSRIIHELGNIEVYEIGQMSNTTHCHSCFKHMSEGLAFCPCGTSFRPDDATKDPCKIPNSDCALLPNRQTKGQNVR